MMASRNAYNWPRIFRQAQEFIKNGGTPQFAHIAKHLNIPENTLYSGFRREFGVSSADLPGLPSRLLSSSDKEDALLPAQYNGIAPELVKSALERKPLTLSELANKLDRGPQTVNQTLDAMILDGYEFTRTENRITADYKPAPLLPTLWDEPKERIRFAVGSDTHFGSKHIQVSAILRFIQIAVEEYGIEHFLWAGDMTAGVGVYRGQSNDLYAHSAEEQLESFVRTFPIYKGVQHIMIAGNHDYSFMKQNGFNIVKAACDKREDFTYAGFDYADIPLTQNKDGDITASAVLWHPSGGVPYALSYRGQKMAAEVTRQELAEIVMEEKNSPTVRFIFWGHLHVSDIFPHGPIWVIGPGCFEGTTNYLNQKGLRPIVQGMIVEADITDRGIIAGMHLHPIPFMEQDNDYKAAYVPHLEQESQVIEPVFRAG